MDNDEMTTEECINAFSMQLAHNGVDVIEKAIPIDYCTTIEVEAIVDAIARWNSNPNTMLFMESSWQNGVINSVSLVPKWIHSRLPTTPYLELRCYLLGFD